MAGIRVSVLGPVQIDVGGNIAKLSPRALRVLMRLVAADGAPVSVKQLRWELWREQDRPHEARNGRNQVQKGISELRKVLGAGELGAAAEVVRTEQLYSGPQRQSAYRLVLEPENFDAAEFSALVDQALHGAAATAADQLTRAVALWRGRPLAQAGDEEYAVGFVQSYRQRYWIALRELVRVHRELGRFDLALPIAERLAAQFPDDSEAALELDAVRGELRARHGDELLRRAFPNLHTEVAIVKGDLFDQPDANLVVGFTDTFDLETKQDQVISRSSVQGQLVDRLYGGHPAALERELRRELKAVAPVARETSRSKLLGKRTRYPVGTVITIRRDDGRRVFAAAYSYIGNDLIARSKPEDLAATLERVWECAAQFGQMTPIAMPLLGSGLARITELAREQLIGMIVDSFLRGCRKHGAVTPQLRIVLRPADLGRINLAQVAHGVTASGD